MSAREARNTMTSDIVESARRWLQDDVKRCSHALQAFPKGAVGLTSYGVKTSPEYQAAKQDYDGAFKRLRAFNQKHKPVRKSNH